MNFLPATYTSPNLATTSTAQLVGSDAASNDVLSVTIDGTASSFENVTDPPSTPSNIAGLMTTLSSTSGMVTLGAAVTTTATTEVDFYLDSNHDGLLETGTDQLLGADTDGSDGWSVTIPKAGLPVTRAEFLAVDPDSGLSPAFAGDPPGLPPGPLPPGTGSAGSGVIIFGAPTLVRTPNDQAIVVAAQVNDFDTPVGGTTVGATLNLDGSDRANVLAAGTHSTSFSSASGGYSASSTDMTQPGLGVGGLFMASTSADAPDATISSIGTVAIAATNAAPVGQSWTVNGNGALIDGVAVTNVIFNVNFGDIVAAMTSAGGSGWAAANATLNLTVTAAGHSLSVTDAAGGNLTIVIDGVTANYTGLPTAHPGAVSALWTLPVNSTIGVNYTNTGLGTTALTNDPADGIPDGAGSARAIADVLFGLDMIVVGWE